MRFALIVLLATVAIVGGAQNKEEQKSPQTLWAALSTSRPVYRLPFANSGDNQFVLHFAVVNDGDRTVNPDVESSKLIVNGVEMKDWPFIIGNGIKSSYNKALPTGRSLTFTYAMGRHFEKPGIYKITWKGKGFESPEITFRVLAQNP